MEQLLGSRGDKRLELAVGLAATAAVQAKRIRAVKKRISQVFECLFEVGVCRVMFLYTDTLMHEARLAEASYSIQRMLVPQNVAGLYIM